MRSVTAVAFAACLLAATAIAGQLFNHRDYGYQNLRGTLRASGNGWTACDPMVVQHSGYFDINATMDKHYFYWMFEAKQNPSTAPVILWLTGGPGCSSSLAVLAENGPCHINETTGQLYSNPYSWNTVANVIYIDQPAGVGFSYSNGANPDHNETMIANDMYAFVQAFMNAYPKYKDLPFFVYGESYGGHFAPATAHRIWVGNNKNEGVKINLKGLSTGNGMTQPQVQLQYYSKLSYEWCNIVKGAPCVNESTYNAMEQQIPKCVELIKQCNAGPVANSACDDAYNLCLDSQLAPFEMTGLNVYDIRKQCDGPLCYNFAKATAFMNRADVQQSLGVASQNITWQACSMRVNGAFTKDWMRNFDYCAKDLLNAGIRVMVYSGDVDFICNWLGNKAWTLELEWNGKAGYNNAHDFPWWVNQKPAGRVRVVSSSSNNNQFAFVQIHDAGHMVPMDQPQVALKMVEHFVLDKPFFLFDGPF